MKYRITNKNYCENRCKYREYCEQENCEPICYNCSNMSKSKEQLCKECNAIALIKMDRCYFKLRKSEK